MVNKCVSLSRKGVYVIEPVPDCAMGGGVMGGGVEGKGGDGVDGSEAADDVGVVAVLVVRGQAGFGEGCLARG